LVEKTPTTGSPPVFCSHKKEPCIKLYNTTSELD
jgi:hypothetical protein